MTMQYWESKVLFGALYLVVYAIAILSAAGIVAHYQNSNYYGGVLLHVWIGSITPLFAIYDGHLSFAFAIMITSYQYLQTIQNQGNNDGNILQYATGFAIVSLTMAGMKYVYEQDGMIEEMRRKKKKYPRKSNYMEEFSATNYPQRMDSSINGVTLYGRPARDWDQ